MTAQRLKVDRQTLQRIERAAKQIRREMHRFERTADKVIGLVGKLSAIQSGLVAAARSLDVREKLPARTERRRVLCPDDFVLCVACRKPHEASLGVIKCICGGEVFSGSRQARGAHRFAVRKLGFSEKSYAFIDTGLRR